VEQFFGRLAVLEAFFAREMGCSWWVLVVWVAGLVVGRISRRSRGCRPESIHLFL